MHNRLQPSARCITLSTDVLQHLNDLATGALRVYIYLCGCNRGQTITAIISEISLAVGLKRRAVDSGPCGSES
jgi:hypothetical protein